MIGLFSYSNFLSSIPLTGKKDIFLKAWVLLYWFTTIIVGTFFYRMRCEDSFFAYISLCNKFCVPGETETRNLYSGVRRNKTVNCASRCCGFHFLDAVWTDNWVKIRFESTLRLALIIKMFHQNQVVYCRGLSKYIFIDFEKPSGLCTI